MKGNCGNPREQGLAIKRKVGQKKFKTVTEHQNQIIKVKDQEEMTIEVQ